MEPIISQSWLIFRIAGIATFTSSAAITTIYKSVTMDDCVPTISAA